MDVISGRGEVRFTATEMACFQLTSDPTGYRPLTFLHNPTHLFSVRVCCSKNNAHPVYPPVEQVKLVVTDLGNVDLA